MHALLLASWLVVPIGLDFERVGGEWTYVIPASANAVIRPRVIAMEEHKPDELRESTAYRGTKRRYGQIRYGSPASVRVAIVLDERGDGPPDLYVDVGRDRRIDELDRVAGEGGVWHVAVNAEVLEDDKVKSLKRSLIFKYGATSGMLAVATEGWLEGRATIGDAVRLVRRIDADANGMFTDPADRLGIDLDGDGRISDVVEIFPFTPIIALDGKRYAVRSDPFGRKLTFERLTGEGMVRIGVVRRSVTQRVTSLTATLVGRDGSSYSLAGADSDRAIPVGEYRLSSVAATLSDPAGGEEWHYVFSNSGGRSQRDWHKLDKGASLAIDPFAGFEMEAQFSDDRRECRRDELLTVSPRLYTRDGLLINSCTRGRHEFAFDHSGPCATVALLDANGKPLGTTTSGFA